MKVYIVIVKVKVGEQFSFFVDRIFTKKEKAHERIREMAEIWANSKYDIVDRLDNESYERIQVFTEYGYRVYCCEEEVLED